MFKIVSYKENVKSYNDNEVHTGNLISFGEGGVFTGVLSVTSTISLIGLR